MNVYFISGMCVNCSVFKNIKLPAGYQKKYIEWNIPDQNETLEDYVARLAENIDKNEPFAIVGYSLGGIMMQEMNKILSPEKNILISSIKNEREIPRLFKIAKISRIPKYAPQQLYSVNKTISNIFTRLVYNMSIEEVEECVSYTSPEYMKWATYQITNWRPEKECKNLYHIHGTKDQVFPFSLIKENVYIVPNADHLMVMNRPDEVNQLIAKILLNK